MISVDRELLGTPEVYGDDRVFVYLRLDGADAAVQIAAVAALDKAGHPIVRVAFAESFDLGQEFFRSEVAVVSIRLISRTWGAT